MPYYLGLDSSTQGLKAIIIDKRGIVAEESVNFGKDLPEYHSPNGFLENDNPEICHADPLLWLAALDLLFQRIQRKGFDLSVIAGISGSGQQHGSVYLNSRFEQILNSLDSNKTLAEQLAPALSRKTSPIWRDHSTTEQCKVLTAKFREKLQRETGSAATERFTGPQIMKFAQEEPSAWQQTTRVHLVSSFLCSVLCGKSAPIDYGDGAGMNLLNLKNLKWDSDITAFTASGLMGKLPDAVPSNAIAGGLCAYFEKYGLKRGIPVVVWSGDNPNSLIGTGCAHPGTVGISLGTSDTVFAPVHSFLPDVQGTGHIMGNPAGGFMSLICFANGSLARDEVRKKYRVDWHFFDETACESTKPGNYGRLVLPRFIPECTPSAPAGVVYNYEESAVSSAENIRALLESQALAMRLHTKWLPEKITRIRLTGGASKAAGFRQILADVFQADVETIEVTESAALGAAMRAANAAGGYSFADLEKTFCRTVHTVSPRKIYAGTYDEALVRYAEWEQKHRIWKH